MHDVSHGELRDLSTDRSRDVGDLNDLLRDVVGTRIFADLRADPVAQGIGEGCAVGQPHEQYDAHVAVAVSHLLANDEALDDLRQLLDLPINLGRTDPYTSGIERRIAASVDHDPV